AERLGWHIDSVVKCGLAGTVFFTWTDEWFTGGEEITDWAFGIVTRERKPKKAFYTLEEKLARRDSIVPHLPLPRTPFVSVVVCSYNGARTLAACLDSLGKLNYPEYEVILVDDGSTDDTAYIEAQFPWVRYIHQSNQGLSHARNTGAAAAKGDVFAYTDSECMADVDYLYFCLCRPQAGFVLELRQTSNVFQQSRSTFHTFLQQQAGNDQPESLHRFKHLIFFHPTGPAKRRDQLYGIPRYT